MLWFRFYHEALDDLKVQQLSPPTFKHWVNLLCLANLTTPRGTLPDIPTIAYRLRVNESKAKALLAEFIERGLLDRDGETLRPHNWEVRQKRSDNVADRVAKHRSNVTDPLPETGLKQDGNVLEKSREEKEESRAELESEKTPKPPVGDLPSVVSETTNPPKPYDLLEALCDAIGSNPSDLSEQDKGKQLKVAKRLIDGGMTAAELRSLVQWLRSQDWRTDGIDFFVLDKQVSKWRMNGRPTGPPGQPRLPEGFTWNDVEVARNKVRGGWTLTSDDRRLLEIVDGKAAA